ncbi:MAG: HD domain-containing phosphohydrolase [Pseudomonadota bacterium]
MDESPKIIVVDDDLATLAVISRILTKFGFTPIEVNDPLKVEDYILYSDFKLLITDLKMPGRDGLEVLRIVRRTKPEVPVVILTGYGTIDSAIEATKLGAAEFMSKPFNPEELIKVINKHALADQRLPGRVKQLIANKSFKAPVKETTKDRVLLHDEIISTATIPDGYVEVKFEEIVPGEVVPFELFIQIFNKKEKNHYLRRLLKADEVFHTGLRNMLFRRKLGSVFIRDDDYRKYLNYRSRIESIPRFRHEMIKDKKKLVLYGKAMEAVIPCLSEPVDEKTIQSAVNLVDDIFRTMVKDPDVYFDMYKLFTQDTSVFNHCANVCLLCISFGLHLKLDPKNLHILGLGALYHDIGLNKIDKAILEKPGPLTKSEWAEIRLHPERGSNILKKSLIYPVTALRIISEHHEKADGSGYPHGLKGPQISTMARICRVVDCFDALSTEKPYRAAMPPALALKTIFKEEPSERGRVLVKKFIEFLGGRKKR